MRSILISFSMMFVLNPEVFAAKVSPVLTCVERNLSPTAAIYRVWKTGKQMQITKVNSGESEKVLASEDVSDGDLKKTKKGFRFSVNRGRSGYLEIERDGDNSTVDIQLYVPSMKILNTNGVQSNFTCEAKI